MLCSVDVDKDGVTDVLLVGAPMFMNNLKKEEGRVYLFTITKVRTWGRGLRLMGISISSKRQPASLHLMREKSIIE